MLVTGVCTRQNIKDGQKFVSGRSFTCPMCFSIRDLVKSGVDVQVAYDRIYFYGETPSIWIDNTEEIRERMRVFDYDMKNPNHQPFTYELDIPQELLR